MKKPFIRRFRVRHSEAGVTMVLVSVAMVAIVGMAVLSIDVVTLYLAKEEAQRAADAAALAAARIISVSGITGDPTNSTSNWNSICGPDGIAKHAALAVAAQNTVGTQTSSTVSVTYSAGTLGTIGSATSDCTTLSGSAFGVNPLVTVQLNRTGLPNFFSRMWGSSGNSLSASATAEVFNPSGSDAGGNQTMGGTIIPVQPRCVKPFVVPNLDPQGGAFVDRITGALSRPGISLNGTGATGVIGEKFWMIPDCKHGNPNYCDIITQPTTNYNDGSGYMQSAPSILGIPAQLGSPVTAVPSCSGGDAYEDASAGCDSSVNYQCGVANAGAVDLTKHNPGVNSLTNAMQCLIHQTDSSNINSSSGQDYLKTTGSFGAPSAYPFQILAGTSNPLGAGLAGTAITTSSSIVTIPIYDQINTPVIPTNSVTSVTFIGFLQVFVNAVDANGNRLVTVLNVSGCGNGTGDPVGTPVAGTSPVPVRLITPP